MVIIGISARYVEEHADNNQVLVQQVPDMKMMLRVYKQLYSMMDNLPRMDKLWLQAQSLWNELVTGNSPIKIKPWIPTTIIFKSNFNKVEFLNCLDQIKVFTILNSPTLKSNTGHSHQFHHSR